MPYSLEKVGDNLLVKVEGDLTVPFLGALREEILRSRSDAGSVLFDLGAVEDMDSAGFQLLFAVRQVVPWMEITSASDTVKDCLETLGMSVIFGLNDGC